MSTRTAGTLTGTGTLVRFFLRRDRFALLWWIIGGVVLYVSQAASVEGLYATQAQFDRAAASMQDNAAFIAMAGPARVLNTVGGQVAWQASAFGAIVAGLMSMFMVGRHTRAEEESGRDELVRAGVVGRYAPVAAAIVVVTIANVVLGAAIAGGLVAYDLPVAGSVSLGVAATTAGLVFGGTALLAAQLTDGARSMYGITGAAIGLAYVLRAVGDIGDGTLSWLSPIGWGQAMRAYAGEIWWPALLSVGAAVVVTAIALRVLDHRDIGAGVLPSRPGPARAGAGLGGCLGLAWRLQRGSLAGWGVALLLIGLAYGSIGTDVGDLIGDSPQAAEMFAQTGGGLVDSFYSTTALMMALIGSGYAVQAALRLRTEEAAGRVEPILATRVPRARWVASHLLVALAGSAVVVALGGLGTGLAYGLTSGDASQIARLLGASLVHVPAVWVLVGLTVALVALVPRWASLAWAALAFCFVMMMFGALLRLPGWLVDLSPFTHMPLLPVEDPAAAPLVATAIAAAVLCAIGLGGFARRDVQT